MNLNPLFGAHYLLHPWMVPLLAGLAGCAALAAVIVLIRARPKSYRVVAAPLLGFALLLGGGAALLHVTLAEETVSHRDKVTAWIAAEHDIQVTESDLDSLLDGGTANVKYHNVPTSVTFVVDPYDRIVLYNAETDAPIKSGD